MPSPWQHAESLAASRLRSKTEAEDVPVHGNVEPVPARLTPRGSLVALAAVPAEASQEAAVRARPPDAPVVAAAKVALGAGNNDQSAFRTRAEAAEQQVRKLRMENKKLEGEVRKLRADAYFQRIGKNLQGPRSAGADKPQDSELASGAPDTAAADAWAARLVAEERAVQAETEVLRLHTELQAARIQFAIISDKTGLTTAPPPESPKLIPKGVELPEYDVQHCFRYVCGCLRAVILQFLLTFCICFRSRSARKHCKMVDRRSDLPDEAPVKTFCVVDRA